MHQLIIYSGTKSSKHCRKNERQYFLTYFQPFPSRITRFSLSLFSFPLTVSFPISFSLMSTFFPVLILFVYLQQWERLVNGKEEEIQGDAECGREREGGRDVGCLGSLQILLQLCLDFNYLAFKFRYLSHWHLSS